MKKTIRLTELDLHKLIENTVKRVLNENFSSSIIQNLSKEHGGVKLDDDDINSVKNILSQITDDMIDTVYDSKEEYINKTNNELNYAKYDVPFWISFKDGSIVTLKQPQDAEQKSLYNRLFNKHSGTVWGDMKRDNRRSAKRWADRNREEYIPDGFRGGDYYQIMKDAKNNGYKIPDYDKDPNKSINKYGSELDRTMERMHMAKAKRQGNYEEYLDYLNKKHKNYSKNR